MTFYRFTPRRASQLFVLLFCFAATAFPLSAQNNKGTILGTITDAQGGLVNGAKVTAVNLSTNTPAEDTSNEEGLYTIPNLDPGMYRVTIEATGFKTVVNQSVRLETNARLPIDAQLEVGSVGGDVVTVTDQGPLVESETSVR
ncbi:MAG TPA: carboxypeptidase-like regulatory domain-containing protein, partial [Pyrinomonadaceae bacterium]